MKKFDFTWIPYEIKYYNNVRKEKKTQVNYAQTAKRYSGREMIDACEVNRLIFEYIERKRPCFIGRVGGSEMKLMAYYFRNLFFPFRTDARKDYLHNLCVMSGFFPEDMEMGEEFVK